MSAKKDQAGKRRHPRYLRNLRSYFLEYCNNTSIHGFKYLGERRSSTEKIFWAVCLAISLYHCVHLISRTYHKWARSPVVVTFSTNEMPIWEVPFPAVTICPRTKAIKSKFNFTRLALLKNEDVKLNPEEMLRFEYMSLLCSSNLNLFSDKHPSKTVDASVLNFFEDVQPDFREIIKKYSWVGLPDDTDIYQRFKQIITSEGVCYTFNMLDRDEVFNKDVSNYFFRAQSTLHEPPSQWSAEEGYSSNATLHAYPRRTVVPGNEGGLSLTLQTIDEDLDYICGDALQGYNVILHQPGQYPNPKLGSFRIGLDQDVVISVKPNVMKTSKQLRKYSYQERNCYLFNEKKLTFFKIYNQQNCLFECYSKFTNRYCNCVGFYMPRNNSTPICGPAMQSCLDESYAKFLKSEISFLIDNSARDIDDNSDNVVYQDCNCLPSCENLNFDAEVSQSNWDWYQGSALSNNESQRYHLSKLKIYFKDMQFITSQRNELYGVTDFLANCGGLLGLFTGFSLLSLVEIVYFATLRLVCNYKRYGKRTWSGDNDLSDSEEEDG